MQRLEFIGPNVACGPYKKAALIRCRLIPSRLDELVNHPHRHLRKITGQRAIQALGAHVLAFALLGELLPSPALAAENIWGAGSASCADLLSANDRGDKAALLAAGTWAQGYLSAVNTAAVARHEEPLRFAEPRDIMLYIMTYCVLSGRARVVDAVEAFEAHEKELPAQAKRP